MTTSTNAMLYYGFTFCDEEEDELPWAGELEEDGDYDWENWACKYLGGPEGPKEKWSEENKNKYHKYWDAKRKFIAGLPVLIDSHCYIDSPMYFICIKDSLTVAHRGYPQKLEPLSKEATWGSTLKNYCEKLNIEWQDPHWELASMWS